MSQKTAKAAETAAEKGVQRCIAADCGASYPLTERIYLCPRCGGTLEVDCHLAVSSRKPAERRKTWAARAGPREAIDVSGVGRYREVLPFDEPIPFVTLFEG